MTNTSQIRRQSCVRIAKSDTKRRLVYGEVYAPYELDSHGEFMLPDDIELMAHRALAEPGGVKFDTNHDNKVVAAHVVESFVARAGDKDFRPGAWVLGVKIIDLRTWEMVERGEINGFSFEAMVLPVEYTVTVAMIRDRVGKTEETDDGHSHGFFVSLNEKGKVIEGRTSPAPDGHTHIIRRGSVTESTNGHTHRYFL